MQNQIDQQPSESFDSNGKRFTILMFGGILLIAIPLYSLLIGRMVSKTSISQKTALQAIVQPASIPTPIPTVAPIAIAHKQDIDAALQLIDGTDTSDVEKQLDQINTSASSFSQ